MTDKFGYMAKFYKGKKPIDFKTFMKEFDKTLEKDMKI